MALKGEVASIGIVLLAAGRSSRLGQPKQLLQLNGISLLQHSLQTAIDAGTGPVVVVLGANAEAIGQENDPQIAQVVYNEQWQEGMAASIRCGIARLLQTASGIQGVILMVCDQPHVSPHLLHNLIDTHRTTGKPIVTCSYADTFGPPTFFHKQVLPQLLQLKGDVGARSVIKQQANEVATIPFPEGMVDIDTEADYQKWKTNADG